MTAAPPLTDAYIALVKQAILDMVYPTEFRPVTKGGPLRQWILRALRARGFVIAKVVPITAQRVEGTEWPGRAMSMMGIPRMDRSSDSAWKPLSKTACLAISLRRGSGGAAGP